MALNRSPEFKSLNPKPSAAKLLVNRSFLFIFSYVFYASNPGVPCVILIWTLDLHLNKLSEGPLGNATYLISSI